MFFSFFLYNLTKLESTSVGCFNLAWLFVIILNVFILNIYLLILG